jgi:hypothetical protein
MFMEAAVFSLHLEPSPSSAHSSGNGMDSMIHISVAAYIDPKEEPLTSASPFTTATIDTTWVLALNDSTPANPEVDELLSRMAPCSRQNLFALILGCIYGVNVRMHQKVFLMWGVGGEGKSALNKAIIKRFGVQKTGNSMSHNIENFKGAHSSAYIAGMVYLFTGTFGIWWFLNYLNGIIMCLILVYAWCKYK